MTTRFWHALAKVATTRKKRKQRWLVHPVVKRRSQHGTYHHLLKELELWGEISANTSTHVIWMPSRTVIWMHTDNNRIPSVHVWFGSTTSMIWFESWCDLNASETFESSQYVIWIGCQCNSNTLAGCEWHFSIWMRNRQKEETPEGRKLFIIH